MADEPIKTQEELLAEMDAALKSGDWKAVSRVSSQIAKVVKTQESAEKEAKLAAIAGLTEKVKKAIDKAIATIEFPEEADGVWYSNDFGEALATCRLVKGAARRTGGGGGGKKFSITTNELLERHGDKVIETGDLEGHTYRSVYEGNTEGNSRYKIRMKLLKLDGQS